MKPWYAAMAVTPWEVESLDWWAEEALKRGATAFVLRLRQPPSWENLRQWARRWEGIPWIIHARWATQPIGWGMHFPAPPLSPPPKPDPSYLYGQSCHTPEEVAAAAPWASYVWVGPFFPTPSHPEHGSFWDLAQLSLLRKRFPSLPLIAIGGIDAPERIEALQTHGAAGFAAIRYFLSLK